MPSLAGHFHFRLDTVTLRSFVLRVAAIAIMLGATGAKADVADLQALQQQARQLNLANSAMWRTLLRYRVQPLTRRDRSLADDPDFFLSPQGASNPQEELDATLASFFDTSIKHALDQSADYYFEN